MNAEELYVAPVGTPPPGDDLVRQLADRERKAAAEAYEVGYRWALTHLDDEGVQADLARYQEEQRERLVDELQVRLAEALADRDHARAEVAALRSAYDDRGDSHARIARKLHAVTEERNVLQVQARVCREDADHNAARAEKAEQSLAAVNRSRDALHQEAQRAREQAAECMREAAQLHRQLDSLGTNPDRLAEQVGAGMAVELFGRVYVDRELASATYATARMREDVGVALDLLRNGHTDPELWAQENRAAVTRLYAFRDTRPPYDQVGADRVLGEGVYATAELEEAGTGVFVPVPKGHMLSVTVTPYEDAPAE